MVKRRLDEVAEWTPASSGPPAALRGLWRTHRLGIGRFLLPRLTPDFAAPGDVLRLIEARFLGRHVLGLANLTRRRALLPNPWRYSALAFLLFGTPNAVGFAFGRVWIPAVALVSGLLFAGWIFADTVIQLRHYVISGSASSFTFWRTIRGTVLNLPDPPPPPEPSPQKWQARLGAAFAGTLERTEAYRVAELAVPDGALVPCEPFQLHERAKHAIDVPAGTWPVTLAIAVSEYDYGEGLVSEERVSHAWVTVSEAAPKRWRLAKRGRARIEVGVDSGIACFTSGAGAGAVERDFGGDRYGYVETLSDALVERMRTRQRESWSWAAVGAEDSAQLVAFSSGAGDGTYPVYLGFDSDGALAAVAIDFRLVPEVVIEPWRDRYEINWS